MHESCLPVVLEIHLSAPESDENRNLLQEQQILNVKSIQCLATVNIGRFANSEETNSKNLHARCSEEDRLANLPFDDHKSS